MKVNGKWYPKSVLVGSTITTEQVAKRVAAKSTHSILHNGENSLTLLCEFNNSLICGARFVEKQGLRRFNLFLFLFRTEKQLLFSYNTC